MKTEHPITPPPELVRRWLPEEGSQMVRVRDLMAWAEQTASNLEKTDDN